MIVWDYTLIMIVQAGLYVIVINHEGLYINYNRLSGAVC